MYHVISELEIIINSRWCNEVKRQEQDIEQI